MNPVMLIIVPGFLGGLVIALIVIMIQRRRTSDASVVMPHRLEPLSTDMINMAHIKVAGVGGLGLVAMAAAVAFDVPMIGISITIALVLGTITAVIMIVRTNRSGPMPSSGSRMGANTVLSIDEPHDPSGDVTRTGRRSGNVRLAAT